MMKDDNKIPVVKIIKASKIYGGNHAIRDVDLDLYEGEIHALAGENGAGKSTLMKALSGAIRLTSGKILLNGIEQSFNTPHDALEAGISMVYQEPDLVNEMTVGQNIFLGNERVLMRLRGIFIGAQQILQSMKFGVDTAVKVGRLGEAKKRMVEIARAILFNPKVIIFDEPTATMTPEEKMYLFSAIRSLASRKISVLFISHALEESLELADRITVLRDGEHIITADAKTMTRETLVRHMVGRSISKTHYVKGTKRQGEVRRKKRKVLKVENVIKRPYVKNMSFTVYSGEITGIAGLVGAGRTEIAKIIYGAWKRNVVRGGMIYLDNKPIRYRVPAQAINDGIVYVTEDRKRNGFFETMTIHENIYLGWLATKIGHRFFISKKDREEIGNTWIERLKIRALDPKLKLIELSGGNQQKAVVAKSLVQKPKLVIFDEPIHGVDVGAIDEIHSFIRSLVEEDIGIIVISSYLPEVMSISDRILVAKDGRIVEEFRPEDATQEKIMYAAVH